MQADRVQWRYLLQRKEWLPFSLPVLHMLGPCLKCGMDSTLYQGGHPGVIAVLRDVQARFIQSWQLGQGCESLI